MKRRAQHIVLPALILIGGAWLPAAGQQRPGAPPASAAKPVDPAFAASEAAYLALPEPTRIAVQNDLVWLGDYKGPAFGTFGRLTHNAILSLQKRLNAKTDGILTEAQIKALAKLAETARAAVGFTLRTDAATGSGIGIPGKLLTHYEKVGIGGKWLSEDGSLLLETVKTTPEKADLAATFERFVNAAVPGRKVTYKLLRPDFFVVTGETGTKRFYTRFAPTPEGLRGYTLTYDAARAAELEPIVIAVANTFEPLRASPAAPPASPPQAGAAANAPPAAQRLVAPPVPAARLGTALLVADGKAVTAAKGVAGCAALTVAGKPARVGQSADGLALVEVAGQKGEVIPLATTPVSPGDALLALGFDSAQPAPQLAAAPGTARLAQGKLTLPAALQEGAAGALVLDAHGSVAGMVLDLPPLNRQIAGTVPLANYAVADAATIKRFMEQNGISTAASAQPTRSPAAAAAAFGKHLALVSCRGN